MQASRFKYMTAGDYECLKANTPDFDNMVVEYSCGKHSSKIKDLSIWNGLRDFAAVTDSIYINDRVHTEFKCRYEQYLEAKIKLFEWFSSPETD